MAATSISGLEASVSPEFVKLKVYWQGNRTCFGRINPIIDICLEHVKYTVSASLPKHMPSEDSDPIPLNIKVIKSGRATFSKAIAVQPEILKTVKVAFRTVSDTDEMQNEIPIVNMAEFRMCGVYGLYIVESEDDTVQATIKSELVNPLSRHKMKQLDVIRKHLASNEINEAFIAARRIRDKQKSYLSFLYLARKLLEKNYLDEAREALAQVPEDIEPYDEIESRKEISMQITLAFQKEREEAKLSAFKLLRQALYA